MREDLRPSRGVNRDAPLEQRTIDLDTTSWLSHHPRRGPMGCILGVDVGGTFTDLVVVSDERRSHPRRLASWKTLSTPEPSVGVMSGIQVLLAKSGIGIAEVDWVVHGTTIGCNLVVEGKGAIVGLITTAGFEDILQMGRQYRHNPFDVLDLQKHEPLVSRRLTIGVHERLRADGSVHLPLDEAEILQAAVNLVESGANSLAVAFIHAYRYSAHERRAAELVRSTFPDIPVSVSHEVAPVMREYVRFSTTVLNAYMRPAFAEYLNGLASSLAGLGFKGHLSIMKSNGGSASPAEIAQLPVYALESGPAAGVQFAARVGRTLNHDRVLAFDMGGTTAKASLISDGQQPFTDVLEVDRNKMRPGTGVIAAVPSVDLAEVGAGGGSIAAASLGTIQVGPASAGSVPGPVCYGLGGTQPTVTDAAVVLGHIGEASLVGGRMSLDRAAARDAVEKAVARELGVPVEIASWGIAEFAVANMVNAVRAVSIDVGVNAGDYTLVATGGAGPLHASRVARQLGMQEVIVPPAAGVGSAVGLVDAPPRWDHVESAFLPISTDGSALTEALRRVHRNAVDRGHGTGGESHIEFYLSLHYAGQGHSVEVACDLPQSASIDPAVVRRTFEMEYVHLYGHAQPDLDVIVSTIRVCHILDWPSWIDRSTFSGTLVPDDTRPGARAIYCGPDRGWLEADVYSRAQLTDRGRVTGPVVVQDSESTCLVLPGETAELLTGGFLVVRVPPVEVSNKSVGDGDLA